MGIVIVVGVANIFTLLYDTPMPHDDPKEIADHLIKQHGLDGAIQVAMKSAATADDNYALSVWREVKQVLRDQKCEK